jgi:Leucine-rich repeat (LRR) protein
LRSGKTNRNLILSALSLTFITIHMKKCCALLLLAIIWQVAYSQFPTGASKPIFANKADSTAYYSVMNAVLKIMMNPGRQANARDEKTLKTLDSLRRRQALFADRIIGYRIDYEANKKFTNYRDLKNGTIKAESVTQLSLADLRLRSIPSEIYQCKNLQELELVNTTIEKFPSRLNKLLKLKSVYVYNNNSRGPLKLRRNRQVQTLIIRGVRSEALPTTYKRFSALDTLDLSRNINLTLFPDIYRNKQLKKLNLLENYLTLEDLKPIQNQSLQELNLMKNRIVKVPDAIGSFTGLKKLAFNYNRITTVAPGLSKLSGLESVSFYQNSLESFPQALYDMPSLVAIDLYFNQIRSVEPGITKLQKLRTLYLSNNKLAALPSNIGELSNLQAFYLHSNRLSELPESIGQLKSLKILRINNNQFTLFPTPVLALDNLENLDVSENLLHEFPTELSRLTKLQILVLGGNPWENRMELRRTAETLETTGTIVHGK